MTLVAYCRVANNASCSSGWLFGASRSPPTKISSNTTERRPPAISSRSESSKNRARRALCVLFCTFRQFKPAPTEEQLRSRISSVRFPEGRSGRFSGVPEYFETVDSRTRLKIPINHQTCVAVSIGLVCGCVGAAAVAAAAPPTNNE